MPRAWSDKDERQYEHIKDSEAKQGRGTKRAKAIAAATVNKQRASEGRTKRTPASRSGARAAGARKRAATKKR